MAKLEYPFDQLPEAGETREVAPGVYWLRMPLPFALDHINLWLLKDGDGWVIVDSGLNSGKVRDHWVQILSDKLGGGGVSRIIVTHYHPDHIGLAGWLVERLGAPLWMSPGDYYYCQSLLLSQQHRPPDTAIDFYRRAGFGEKSLRAFAAEGYTSFGKTVAPLPDWFVGLRDGDIIKIDGQEWHILIKSGHSPEHICLYCPKLGVLIAGDQVLPRISTNISVYPNEPEANPLKDWLDSLRTMFELPDDLLILPSHNEPFRGLHQRLNELLDHHDGQLEAVTKACAEKPQSVKDLYAVLFARRIVGFQHLFAAGESLAHLNFLLNQGIIERSLEPDGVNRYRAIGAGA